ncbi:hypothetical protein T265_08904 [Opisthorchis viverrini]|uniref:Uncharacterized protein n=1 Tax=Opisthorchis viverrini TaxID=6198 RepID=A0A074Z7W7_OPIVI|nr:hypothetical protein T265_08904 [Opisthorchis viverrini]KER23173.1 hypothetical protein T265_08904 [Opisthorchis viverrini]
MKQHHCCVSVMQYQKKHYSTCCYANLRWLSTETSKGEKSDSHRKNDLIITNKFTQATGRENTGIGDMQRKLKKNHINCTYRGSQRTLNPLRHKLDNILKRPDIAMRWKDVVRVTGLSDLEGLLSVCGKMIFDLKTVESIIRTPQIFICYAI